MYRTTSRTAPTTTYGLYEAELAYRRERMINDFRAINDAARRRAERRARRDAAVAPGSVLRWIRVHQHATR
jgi:hypothetical protein